MAAREQVAPDDAQNQLVFADLHLHSKYSRAVSPKMDLDGLSEGAKQKGLGVLGTGDFTHPAWFGHLKSRLEESDCGGLFRLKGSKPDDALFMLSCEVSTICSLGPQGVKKVHHIVFYPDLACVAQFRDALSKKGNLAADGRPMFGNMTSAQMADIAFSVSKDAVLVPAHAWTPWFSVLGSKGGYDSVEEAYEDQAKRIFAIESGLSSDPAMNWRVSSLDKYAIISNSDSHSPYPWRLGRECNAFSIPRDKLSYRSMFDAVRQKDKSRFSFTVEVDPNYGKYHYDGHRDCGVCLSPEESEKAHGICPVCRQPLTIGVQHRVNELADRPEGFVLPNAVPFKTVLPLFELICAATRAPLTSKSAQAASDKLMAVFPNELFVLLCAQPQALAPHCDERVLAAIMANREGRIKVSAGYDGEYGVVESFGATRKKPAATAAELKSQKSLSDYCG